MWCCFVLTDYASGFLYQLGYYGVVIHRSRQLKQLVRTLIFRLVLLGWLSSSMGIRNTVGRTGVFWFENFACILARILLMMRVSGIRQII
jgi:uncharacterized membrane protein YhdT